MTNGQPDDLDDWYAAEAAAEAHGLALPKTPARLVYALGLIPLGIAAYFATHRH